ncbi:GntR family transcriptional regulator [Streptomyces sioyaensis]|uniref:GntR family transcriptional regulator n=1 Tax=Streptomyces sioyaensis TaxID=67364 RepID=UPI0037D4B044
MSVVDALIASLRDRVLNGELAPGAALTEADVSADYRVSRPTARSAITALVHHGLLTREANKPARVPLLSLSDIEDLFLVRIPLEAEAVRLLTLRPSPAQLTAVARAATDLDQLEEHSSHSAFAEADLRFHQTIVETLGSPRFSRLFHSLTGEAHLSMVQTRHTLGRDRIHAEHQAILNAVRAGDADAAAHTMRRHLEGARDSLKTVLSEGST